MTPTHPTSRDPGEAPVAEAALPLVAATMNRIVARLRADNLKAGQALSSEAALAADFGVSRTIIREAMRSLAALSILDIGNGRAARVRLPDGDVLGRIVDHAVHTEHVSIQQIYDVRRTVEMRTVELAAMRRSPAEAAELGALVDAMYSDRADPARVMEHDIAFHIGIGRASRNPMFELIVRSFEVVTRQTWRVGWTSRRSEAERTGTLDLHRAISDAILAGDPQASARAMADHFDNSVKALLNAGLH